MDRSHATIAFAPLPADEAYPDGVFRLAPGMPEWVDFGLRLALATLLLTGVALLAAASQPNIDYAPVWPATALGLALMWRHGARYWPAILIANVVNAKYLGVSTWLISFGSGCMELLIAMLALYLLRLYRVRPALSSLNHVIAFMLAGAVASFSALLLFPVVAMILFGNAFVPSLLRGFYYWMTAFFSLLIFTPLLTTLPQVRALDAPRRRQLAALLLVTALLGWSMLAFDAAPGQQWLFLLLPLVIACAVVGGVGGVSAAAAVIVIILILIEQRATPSVLDMEMRLLFVATVTVTGYLLGAVWSDRLRISRELAHRARHDALTGLLNRFEFERLLQATLADGATGSNALLYLDLDQFKLLNDTCGHMAGDGVLRDLSGNLARVLPSRARFARLGGDEFGCLLADCGETTALDIAARLHETIRDFRYVTGKLEFTLGASIGITWFTAGSGDTPDSVLARADIACYAAKEAGRNRTHVYHPSDRDMLRRHSEIQEASQLQAALNAGRFALYVQRIADIRAPHSQRQFYEVLLRLVDGDLHRSVAEFLPVAHRYGLIGHIDRWVLESVAAYLGAQPDSELRLSVNLSGATLDNPGFVELIAALPERFGFAPRQLCLEVTESIAIDHLTRAVEGMQRLRDQGFDIALDDFGAGVASFGYLSELPVSLVKLDGRFVRDIGRDPAAPLVIEALVRVAALRGIECIAEWVDEQGALARLRDLGVAYAQGFLIHEPMPLEMLGR